MFLHFFIKSSLKNSIGDQAFYVKNRNSMILFCERCKHPNHVFIFFYLFFNSSLSLLDKISFFLFLQVIIIIISFFFRRSSFIFEERRFKRKNVRFTCTMFMYILYYIRTCFIGIYERKFVVIYVFFRTFISSLELAALFFIILLFFLFFNYPSFSFFY